MTDRNWWDNRWDWSYSPKTTGLLDRSKRVEALPAADRRTVLKLVDALLETRRPAGR